jgi:hypothetical protein
MEEAFLDMGNSMETLIRINLVHDAYNLDPGRSLCNCNSLSHTGNGLAEWLEMEGD